MTYEEFIKKYKPITNHLVKNAAFNGTMFETYGDEYTIVKISMTKNIWTIVDNEGEFQLVNGFRLVNRIGYILTEKGYENDKDIYIELESNEEEKYKAIAVIDLSNSSLHIYDFPINDDNETIEYVLETTFGHHLSNCNWGEIDKLIDHRDE